MERISATDAARNFSDLLNRVRYQGASFEIARGQEIVARIVPPAPPRTVKVADLDALFSQLPKLGKEDAERFGEDLRSIRREAALPESEWD